MMTRQPMHIPDTWGWEWYETEDNERGYVITVSSPSLLGAFTFETRGKRKRFIDELRQERREYEAEQAIRAQAREVMALAAERRGLQLRGGK